MIYIYRTLWLLFYLPLFIIEALLLIIGIPVFIISGAISFVIYGDVEKTPDWCIPGRLSIVIDCWYKDLLKNIKL